MAPKRGIDWDQVPLGRYDDSDLARRLLTSRQSVALQRKLRGIPPLDRAVRASMDALTPMERRDLIDLTEAYDTLTAVDTIALTFKVAACISLVPGWRIETRHARAQGSGARATAFRFQPDRHRLWSGWLDPRASRVWLLKNGWADAAKARALDLRARTAFEGARAT